MLEGNAAELSSKRGWVFSVWKSGNFIINPNNEVEDDIKLWKESQRKSTADKRWISSRTMMGILSKMAAKKI